MITTIIFDLCEVYLQGFQGVEHRLAPLIGRDASELKKALEGDELRALFHGQMSEDAYWEMMMAKHKLPLSLERLKAVVRENFQEIHGTRNIIEQLKHQGYRLGLLSVHTAEWVAYCSHRYDYHKLFDSVLYSFEVGLSKPDPRIYLTMLERLQAAPDACLFIDDQEGNLTAARDVGIHTIHFTNPEQLKLDLKNFSIIVQ